jgi:hypothetical protein
VGSHKMARFDDGGKGLLPRFCYLGIHKQWFSGFVAIQHFIRAV